MHKILVLLAIVPLAACGGGDQTQLTESDMQDRPSVASVDFGDDNGDWSNDGECDDPRFRGPGMTSTPLLDDDIKHDATDCRTAYERGDLTLIE